MADFQEIDAIINAKSLALVGASTKPLKFGSMFLDSLLRMGFKGDIYPINEKEKEIRGLTCYPDLISLPTTPELVYIAIPAYQCMEVLRQCMGSGVRGVVILAAGFREVGEEGERLEEEALRMAREGGFRIIGPNCFGIYNPRTGLTLPPNPDLTHQPGKVAFITQSGGYGAHFARLGRSMGINFSAVVSYGNGADLEAADFIEYFAEDRETEIIAGYIEGTRDGRRFFETLKQAAAEKPVIMWKVGKGEMARKAVMSHTGSLAGSEEIWNSLLEQCGAVPTQGLEETFNMVQGFYHLKGKPVERLLVMAGGGGLNAYVADLAEERDLLIPPLASDTEEKFAEIFPKVGAVVGNPLDIGTPIVPPDFFKVIVDIAVRDTATDLLIYDLAINFGVLLVGQEGVYRSLQHLAAASKETGKPCVVNLYNRAPDDPTVSMFHVGMKRMLSDEGIPVFEDLRSALDVIAALNRWHVTRF